jgi:hypothetical protein
VIGSLTTKQSNSHNSLRRARDHGGALFSCAEVAIKIKNTEIYNKKFFISFFDTQNPTQSVTTDNKSAQKVVCVDTPYIDPKYDPRDAAAPSDANGDH